MASAELVARFDGSGKRFRLSFKGKTILSHSPRHPCAAVGRGTGRFKFLAGLFKIRGRVTERRRCVSFRVEECSERRLALRFDAGLTMTAEVVDGRLHFRFACPENLNRLWFYWCAEPQEAVYGGGEQYSRLNLRGSRVPIWVQEPGLGRGFDLVTLAAELKSGYGGRWYTSYYSQPTFVMSSGAYLHSESSAYALGHFRSARRHGLEIWEIPEKLVLGVETDPAALFDSLTSFLGRQPKLPSWAYDGMWLGAQGGSGETRRKLEVLKSAGVQVGGLWCQDWEGVRITSFGKQLMWDWFPDEDLYPGLPDYIEALKSEGVRFLGYINPFLALEGRLYKEASAKGYCIKNAAGEDYLVTITTFPAAMLDLTHPGCREWIKGVIKDNMIAAGMAGWMADFGEYLPVDAALHDGSDGLTYHNRYIVDWAAVNREALIEAGVQDELIFFMRAGYTGSASRAGAFWNGDQLVNWSRSQGFPTVIPGSLSLGFSGVGYLHSDLGGYTSVMGLKRSGELLIRWAEQAAFTQIMRSHEGNRPLSGLQLWEDREVLRHLARMTRVFTMLKPYHAAAAEEYQRRGVPPIRHPWVHYPGDAKLHRRSGQYTYMYGPDLLVAPVVAKGQRQRTLYLPEDQWIHLWTGTEYEGGRTRTAAPLGQPPVFYRKNTLMAELFREIGAL